RPGCEQRSALAGSMDGLSCCTTDELVLVLPGVAPARVGVARVRYTPGGTRYLGTSSPRAAIGLDEFASLGRRSLVGAPAPGANPRRRRQSHRHTQSHRGGAPTGKLRCRSTRPGCEQRSALAGSMDGLSRCTADELVLVLPGVAPARVGVARVRCAPGYTLPGDVEPTGRDRTR